MKINLTGKFLLPLIFLLFLLAGLLSTLVTSVLRESMLNRAATFVADFVQLQARNHITDPSVFSTPSPESETLFSKVQSEVKTREVVRIKVWSDQKKVIYSDDQSIVGKIFTDNEELNEALKGKIKTEIVTPSKDENIGEKGYKQLMEIYIPIYLSAHTSPDGVIETYYTLDTLNADIVHAQTQIVEFIVLIFLIIAGVLLILLHFLILHPVKIFEKATKEIAKGNFDNQVAIHSHDELGSLATSFNSMAEGLKRLQELKNEFVYIGAHELKTPVTAITGYISLIFSSEDSKNLSEKIKKYLEAMKALNERLNLLVGDILEIARNEAGKIDIKVEPVNIESVMHEILKEIKPLSDQKQITVSYSQPTREVNVLADSSKLKEVLMNLISNAVKYGSEKGYVNISHELSNTDITTHVTNNGLGIPHEEQQHIFRKFFRAQNVKTADYQGTGLGLFITQELVEKMRGKIWFVSEENKETTFSFSLPLDQTKNRREG